MSAEKIDQEILEEEEQQEMEVQEPEVLEEETSSEETSSKEESLEEDIEEASSEAGEDDERYQQLEDQFLRLQADFANYKRRTTNEKAEYIQLGIKKLALDLLPVMDTFERALENTSKEDPVYQGIEMIMKQLAQALEKNNIVVMKALGEAFDPNLHHAVLVEASEEYPSQHVMDVLQKGYLFNEKTLRPAMVKVSE